MGRVYDALKRAAAGDDAKVERNGEGDSSGATKSIVPVADNGSNGSHAAGDDANAKSDSRAQANTPALTVGGRDDAPELFLRSSRHFQSPETAHRSASTEHTETGGAPALPAPSASP